MSRRPDGEKVGVTREHPLKLRILFTRRVPRVFFLRPLPFLPHSRRHQRAKKNKIGTSTKWGEKG